MYPQQQLHARFDREVYRTGGIPQYSLVSRRADLPFAVPHTPRNMFTQTRVGVFGIALCCATCAQTERTNNAAAAAAFVSCHVLTTLPSIKVEQAVHICCCTAQLRYDFIKMRIGRAWRVKNDIRHMYKSHHSHCTLLVDVVASFRTQQFGASRHHTIL